MSMLCSEKFVRTYINLHTGLRKPAKILFLRVKVTDRFTKFCFYFLTLSNVMGFRKLSRSKIVKIYTHKIKKEIRSHRKFEHPVLLLLMLQD